MPSGFFIKMGGMRWSVEQLQKLFELYCCNTPFNVIAKNLSLDYDQVYTKINYEIKKGSIEPYQQKHNWKRVKQFPQLKVHQCVEIITVDGVTIKRYSDGYANGVWPPKTVR